MSMLNRIQTLISEAHDEVLVCRKWDLHRKDHFLQAAYGRLYPSTHRYYFEGNPSFLNDYASLLDMSRYPLIMLRDGLATLSEFFLKSHRPPRQLDTVLLIDGRFERFVPKTWKDQVAFYKMNFPKSAGPKKSLALCVLAHHFLDNKGARVSFERIKEKARGEPLFYAPFRERFFVQSVDETRYIEKGMQSLYEVFGANYRVETDNNKALDLPLQAGDELLDLHEDLLFVADNFIHHWFAAKNVEAPNTSAQAPSGCLRYPLSMHHSVSIYSPGNEIGANFSELAVDFKLSGLPAKALNKDFISFIQEALNK